MKDYSVKEIIKYAGAYIAFIIGSGYATGQEIMQFFTSYGIWSIGAAIITMIFFAWIGSRMMVVGYEIKDTPEVSSYELYFGKVAGKVYDWFVVIFLFCVVVIMISGAGATMSEYYGLNHYVGSTFMAILVLISFLFGLRKLVDIVGMIGPVIIVFTVFVGLVVLLGNAGGVSEGSQLIETLDVPKAAPNWAVSGLLYASYPLFGAVPFFTALGKDASTRKNALYGGIAGGVVLMLATIVMNLAMLSRIGDVYDKDVPTLFLADSISHGVGILFSIVLICGIFSTAAPMMWTVCSKFADEDSKKGKIVACVIAVAALIGGQLPFGALVGTIYPYTGYLGLVLFACVIWQQIKSGKNKKNE